MVVAWTTEAPGGTPGAVPPSDPAQHPPSDPLGSPGGPTWVASAEARLNEAIGVFARLMARCPVHGRYILRDVEVMLVPPIRLGQYAFLRREGAVVGGVTWGFFDRRAVERHVRASAAPRPEDWRSGDDVWITALIGRELHAPDLLRVVAAMPGLPRLRGLRWGRDRRPRRVVEITRREDGRMVVRGRSVGEFLS